jgi:hypothetical protein
MYGDVVNFGMHLENQTFAMFAGATGSWSSACFEGDYLPPPNVLISKQLPFVFEIP